MPLLLPWHDINDDSWLSSYHQWSDWIRANSRGENALTEEERELWHLLCEKYDARTCEFDMHEWARLQYYRWLYRQGLLNETGV